MRSIIDLAFWLFAAEQPSEPEVSYPVYPLILDNAGWTVFENPSRAQIEQRFGEPT